VVDEELGTLTRRRLLHDHSGWIEGRGGRRREDALLIATWRLDAGYPVEPEMLLQAARLALSTASRRQPSPARRPCRARRGCAPPSHRGARISAPPARITERVGSRYRTRIAGIMLRRPRRLYLCRRCPRPLPAAPQAPPARWSRPVRIDVCSMFARMPRYAPAASGIRIALRIPGDSTKWQLPARASIV
jgi:hypothetical protein